MARTNKANEYNKELYQTPIYRAWFNMKTRCTNPKVNSYKRYGGRGITFDIKWNKFDEFLQDMGETYKFGLTLERIDNNGNYCKENCRWATKKEQANNTRNTINSIHITWNGKTKRISEWASELGIKRTTLDMRIRHYKMPIELALTR